MSITSGRDQSVSLTSETKIKISPPDKFLEKQRMLSSFLTQLDTYIHLNYIMFRKKADKVLYASFYLRFNAFNWFELTLWDYMKNEKKDRDDKINKIFTSLEKFKKQIRIVFEIIDQKRTAERKICNIVQKGAAVTYAVNFQRHAAYMNWDDTALTAQYYKGLKNFIKDKISCSEWPSTLVKMIKKSVIIDNCMYKRSIEKSQKNYISLKANKSHESTQYNNQPYYSPQPMEINATFHQNRFQRGTKQVPKGIRGKGNCYSCEKPGHFTHDCQVSMKAFSPKKKTYAAALKEPAPKQPVRHNAMSWTACYNDSCTVHRSDKDGSGWFPRQPKKAKSYAMTSRWDPVADAEKHQARQEQFSQEGNYVDSDNMIPSSSKEKDFVKVVNSEDSEELLKEDNDKWLFTHKERWIWTYTEILNTLEKKEKYAEQVGEIKNQILYTIWDAFTQRQNREEINYQDIVRETLPKGSQFTIRGRYVTSDRAHTLWELCTRVWEL